VPADWEGLVYCDLDFDEIYRAKQWVDPVGHYSRPDIFSLMVRNEVKRHVLTDAVDAEYSHASRFPQLEEE
jgi:cyanide hydratase